MLKCSSLSGIKSLRCLPSGHLWSNMGKHCWQTGFQVSCSRCSSCCDMLGLLYLDNKVISEQASFSGPQNTVPCTY